MGLFRESGKPIVSTLIGSASAWDLIASPRQSLVIDLPVTISFPTDALDFSLIFQFI